MKLSKLLNDLYTKLSTERQYGVPLMDLLQSQIKHDPSVPLKLNSVDGRGTDVHILAKGREALLASALSSAVDHYKAVELDDDRDSGFRFDHKGLTFTIGWRKRTSAERVQDTARKVRAIAKAQETERGLQTPACRIVFPNLTDRSEARHAQKQQRHAENFATGGSVDLSALEQRVVDHYAGKWAEAGISVKVADGKLVLDLESLKTRIPSVRWTGQGGDPTPVNCRCAVQLVPYGGLEDLLATLPSPSKTPKRKSLDVLPISLKGPRRENPLPRDMMSSGGLQLKIVGSSYRTDKQQEVLRSKNPGNMVLIAHEPDNGHSKHALAVFAWNNGGESYWHHVGYIQDVVARGLVDRMLQFGGGSTERIALKGEFLDDPSFGGNPRIHLSEVWSFSNALRA